MKIAIPRGYYKMDLTTQLAVDNFQNKSGLYVKSAKRCKGSMKDYISFMILYPNGQILRDNRMIRLQKIDFHQASGDKGDTQIFVSLDNLNIR